MSYILEALKKSDAERKRGEVPTLSDLPQETAPAGHSGTPPVLLIGTVAVSVVAVGAIGAWLYFSGDTAPTPVAEAPQDVQMSADQEQAPQQVAEQSQPAPAPEAAVEPAVQAAPETAPEPMPVPTPEPAPVVASAPDPKPVPAQPEPLPEPQDVAVLKAQPAPPPSAEVKAAPIPEPIVVVRPEAKPQNTTPDKSPAPAPAERPTASALPPLKSANAYVNRAWNSMDKGLYGQAIADLDRALTTEPAFADAWFARGWATEKSGDETTAIQDYSRAIDAQPDHAMALFSRGFLNLYGNNPRGAVVDFVRTQGVAQDESLRLYSHLWLYLSRARAGQNAGASLKDDAAKENLSKWPGPLVLLFENAMTESAVLNAIEQGPKDALKERRATGYFFLGIYAQLAGDAERARRYFEKTLATGAIDYRQYDAAQRELNSAR